MLETNKLSGVSLKVPGIRQQTYPWDAHSFPELSYRVTIRPAFLNQWTSAWTPKELGPLPLKEEDPRKIRVTPYSVQERLLHSHNGRSPA